MKTFLTVNLRIFTLKEFVVLQISASLFILSILTAFSGIAQSFSEKKVYTVYVNESEYSIVAEVLAKEKSVTSDADKEYYWYKGNNIMSTKGGYEGKLLHGKYSSFYLNNNLKEKGSYNMGLKDGEWIKWNPSGIIVEISNWKNGFKQGSYQAFNTKQELLISSHYSKDKLHGEVVIYDSGKIISRKKFRHGVEVIPKEKIIKEKKEKPLKNLEEEKAKETSVQQDSTNAPVKVDSSKRRQHKKKK